MHGTTLPYSDGPALRTARIEAAVQRANILIVLGVMATLAMVGVALARAADRGSLVLGILLIPPFAVPTWFGAWLFRRGSSEVYRRACLWLLIVMGLAVILL